MSASEFLVKQDFHSDRRTPVRWVLSHSLRHWRVIVMMVLGALGNAALAAVPPLLIGIAFNAINQPLPDYVTVTAMAIWIVVSQLVRSVVQLGRNFGSQIIGERLERDTRAELYASLLGKSMTFHGLQNVGDVMARATNDVREINLMLNPGINLTIGSAMFIFDADPFQFRHSSHVVRHAVILCSGLSSRLANLFGRTLAGQRHGASTLRRAERRTVRSARRNRNGEGRGARAARGGTF